MDQFRNKKWNYSFAISIKYIKEMNIKKTELSLNKHVLLYVINL